MSTYLKDTIKLTETEMKMVMCSMEEKKEKPKSDLHKFITEKKVTKMEGMDSDLIVVCKDPKKTTPSKETMFMMTK